MALANFLEDTTGPWGEEGDEYPESKTENWKERWNAGKQAGYHMHSLVFPSSHLFVFYFNKRGYSCPAASTRPAGKTALPAKRRSQALCSPTLPLGTDTDIQLPKLADLPLRPFDPFGSDSMLIMQTFDCPFPSH